MNSRNVIIVGGGIVGLATAYRLSERFPDARVTVLEKEAGVGQHQTGHNSGVLHCGLYYKPGSTKARLAVAGIRQMVAFCQENGVPHDVCGKLVVAADETEVPRLRALEERGAANGLEGLRWLSREEMREIEPHVGGVAALRVPQEGIVDYPRVCEALAAKLAGRGAHVRPARGSTGCALMARGGWPKPPRARSRATSSSTARDCTATASPHSPAKSARCASCHSAASITRSSPNARSLVRHLIYPTPDPQFPFLGVHFTRLIHGGIEAGPNAVLAFSREGYRKTDVNLRDLFDALTYGGFWRFLRKYPSMAWYELRRSFSREMFCRSLQRLVPEIRAGRPRYRRLRRARAGDLARGRHGARFPLYRAPERPAHFERSQPRRDCLARHRRRDRRDGGEDRGGLTDGRPGRSVLRIQSR